LSIFAVENSGSPIKWAFRGRNSSREKEEMTMRMIETVTVGLMALAAQVLVVATVFM
jgi:hypothetical protein